MKTLSTLLTSLLVLLSTQVWAQFQGKVYVENDAIKVFRSGTEKSMAWAGGLNNPQYSLADLNNDGLKDLVIYQSDQYSVKTFINKGSVGSPQYQYSPDYAVNFPLCLFYVILKDYNGDGIEDLFESGGIGITIHTGYYNSANQLCFKKYKTLYYNNDKLTTGWINAEVNPGDIPSIVDVDNDGDLDFLSYNGSGDFMNWYQNMQVENGYSKDSITIRLADRCWGKMRQLTTRTHILAAYCDNSALMRTGAPMKRTDGGNTPCLIDMDGDGDYDVLDGHRAFNHVVYLKNGKYPSGVRDSMVFQDTTYNTLGDTVKIAQWAAPFYVDVDQDGNRDLLVSPNTPSASENYYCSQYYKNVGTDKFPSFKYQGDTFLVSDMVDVGTIAYPLFYDYDKDGKIDLFVGNGGYYEKSSGQFISRIMYLHNTSTPGNPSFEIISDDFLGMATRRYKGISLAIGDLDNDGKDDLLLGHFDGSIDFIKNTAVSALVSPVWITTPVPLKDNSGNPVATNSYSAPLVYDIDADGIKDLLIGDQMGSLFYFKNNSTTAGSYNLNLVTTELGFVKSDPEKISSGHSTPFIGRVDNSTKEYLLMGSRSGRIFRYTGFEGGNVFSAYTRLDSAYSYILSSQANATYYMSAPAVADIDNDGKYEMVVGNFYGGLLLFKQDKTVSISEAGSQLMELAIFPNPATKSIIIHLSQTISNQTASINLYNSLGQVVKSLPSVDISKYIALEIGDLANDLYYCVVRIGNEQFAKAIVKKD